MPQLDQETALQAFQRLAGRFVGNTPVEPATVLHDFVRFYMANRIARNGVEAEADMIMLEWGTDKPHAGPDQVIDSRTQDPDRLKWGKTLHRWLGLTREVAAARGEDEAEYQTGDFTLSLFLYFEPVAEEQKAQYMYISSPEEAASKLAEFTGTDYVARLLASRTSRITAFITPTD